MHTGQLGGRIGPMMDPATRQQVTGALAGTFTFQCAGDPSGVLPQLQGRLLQTVSRLLDQKLSSQQVAVQTMPGSLPYYSQEIIAQCNTQDLGVTITGLQLQLSMDSPPPPQAYGGPMPADPMSAMKNAFAQQAQERLDPSNYEVRAKMNIGGFKVNASTDGGLDMDSLGEQAKDKVKSKLVWWAIGCGAILFVVAIIAAIIIYVVYVVGTGSGATGTAKAGAWDGTSTFTCKGNDKVSLEKVTATIASGSAIVAEANCQLTLKNVVITAPVGIEAKGNAKVTVSGGTVAGSEAAAKAAGNAQITFSGTTVSGAKNATPPATITGP
ncbi:MAG: hypothetical protein KF718_03000 [Polyangiaceae bacterium]|nr:hypothetical protein [Polyangiaceae bacterium]